VHGVEDESAAGCKDPGTGQPAPGVARSWEVSSDRRTYTFHLRPEARWSDGRPVTAEDFIRSAQRLLNP
jgi:oligopeptide transport system substrate-binding protein